MSRIAIDDNVQIGIIVADIEAAIAKWSRFLGQEPYLRVTTETADRTGITFRGESTSGRVKVAVFRVGTCDIELLEPLDGPSAWREFLDENGPGLHHVGFLTDNLDDEVSWMADEGIEVAQRASYALEGQAGRYAYFEADPGLAAIVEFNELKPLH